MSVGASKVTVKNLAKVTGTKRAVKHGKEKFQGLEGDSKYTSLSVATEEDDDDFENEGNVLPPVEDVDDDVFEESEVTEENAAASEKPKKSALDLLRGRKEGSAGIIKARL